MSWLGLGTWGSTRAVSSQLGRSSRALPARHRVLCAGSERAAPAEACLCARGGCTSLLISL